MPPVETETMAGKTEFTKKINFSVDNSSGEIDSKHYVGVIIEAIRLHAFVCLIRSGAKIGEEQGNGSKKMNPKVVSPKSTGGGGFVFEDKVAAWALSHLLSNEQLFNNENETLIEKIQWQVRAEGWIFDDLLLTMKSDDGQLHRCAFSIKSFDPFRSKENREHLVKTAWEQFLAEEESSFDRNNDFLVIATSTLALATKNSLDFLIEKIKNNKDLESLDVSIKTPGSTNNNVRRLFEQFTCPSDFIKTHPQDRVQTGKIFSKLHFISFDFGESTSEKEKESIERCRRALRSGETTEAQNLWNRLLRISSECRPNAGCLDRGSLIDNIRNNFELKNLPNHNSDWERLLSFSMNNMLAIHDSIGETVKIQRKDDLHELEQTFENNKIIFLQGESGIGKSVVAKQYVEKIQKQGSKCLWFNASSFEEKDYNAFQKGLNLKYSIENLFKEISDKNIFIVFDGLDRIYEQKYFQIIDTLLYYMEIEKENSPWHIVITCQKEGRTKIEESLMQRMSSKIKIFTKNFDCLPDESLKEVWENFPALNALKYNSKTKSLLNNLKILDLIAGRVKHKASARLIGETNFADWFWQEYIAQGEQRRTRESFVMRLAEQQSDNWRLSIPIQQLPSDLLLALSDLEKDHICKNVEHKISFVHDLYGDLARCQVIVAQENETRLDFMNERINSPLWQRAIRFYATFLLESGKMVEWQKLFKEESSDLLKNLFLEGIIFSVDSSVSLDKISNLLFEEEGKLLKRLLKCFLISATRPSPIIEELKFLNNLSKKDIISLSAKIRSPENLMLWNNLLFFLCKYKETIIRLSPNELIEIINHWLILTQNISYSFPSRKKAAEIGLLMGNLLHTEKRKYIHTKIEDNKKCYQLALLAACEFPDKVADFALEASGRNQKLPQWAKLSEGEEYASQPWADGPRFRLDENFRSAVLELPAMLPLIQNRPNIAKEVILANLIKAPFILDCNSQFGNMPFFDTQEKLEITNSRAWSFPSSWVDGPFFIFLKNNFEKGLETIINLVDFAHERLLDLQSKNNLELKRKFKYFLLEEKELLPDLDGRVFDWGDCFDNSTAPIPVRVALMALEKYFYDINEEERTQKIEIVFKKFNSTAFLRFFCNIGKYQPDLFLGPLKPILTIPSIYRNDLHSTARSELFFNSFDATRGKIIADFNKQFREMPHRFVYLQILATRLFVSNNNIQNYLTRARKKIETPINKNKVRKNNDEEVTFIDIFNIKNYKKKKNYWINIKLEKRRRDSEKEQEKTETELSIISLAAKCRRLISQEIKLNDEDIVCFWKQAKKIEDFVIEPKKLDGSSNNALFEQKIHGLIGAAAALIYLKWNQIKNMPSIKEWCIKKIKEAASSLPAECWDSLVSYDQTKLTWCCFVADALSVLWVENRSNKVLRGLVAKFIILHSKAAVEIFFLRCVERREFLKEDFFYMFRIIFERAYVQKRLLIMKSMTYFKEDETKKFARFTKNWKQKLIKNFSNGSIFELEKDWKKMDPAFELIRSNKIKKLPSVCSKPFALDFQIAKIPYEWMPNLLKEQKISLDERSAWINFLNTSLFCVLNCKNTSEEDYFCKDIFWIFKKIALTLPHMLEKENPEKIWKSILDLPDKKRDWRIYFLRYFHTENLLETPLPQNFISLRNEMLKYALDKTKISWASHDESWASLIGVDNVQRIAWQKQHQEIVKNSISATRTWIKEVDECNLIEFIDWLPNEAASDLRVSALAWLYHEFNKKRINFFLKKEDLHHIMLSINFIWVNHETEIRKNPESFTAFQNLLGFFANKQEPIALELLRTLGSE